MNKYRNFPAYYYNESQLYVVVDICGCFYPIIEYSINDCVNDDMIWLNAPCKSLTQIQNQIKSLTQIQNQIKSLTPIKNKIKSLTQIQNQIKSITTFQKLYINFHVFYRDEIANIESYLFRTFTLSNGNRRRYPNQVETQNFLYPFYQIQKYYRG